MLALLLAAALAPTADAAAFYFADTGTRGLSRSGAFVAGADDLSAQYYNPAALINLDRGMFYFNFSAFTQNVSFTRKDYNDDGSLRETWPVVENDAAPMLIPAFGVGHHFGLPNTYFAVGMWTPVAPSLSYPALGSQHYTLQDSLTWQIFAGPSVAHRFFDMVTIGGGIHWTLVRAEQSLSLMVCQDEDVFDGEVTNCPDDATAEENDLFAEVKAWDKGSLTGNIGILVEPTPYLSIGASATPPTKVKAGGTLAISLSEDHWLLGNSTESEGDDILNSGDAIDEDVTVMLTMPWVLKGGVAVRPVPKLEVELAGGYQGWSATKEIRVTNVELILEDNPDNGLIGEDQRITDDVVLPAGYRDSWSVRLGVDGDITDYLSVRGGAYYETGGVPAQVMTVALVDNDKFGFSLGATGIIADRFSIDVGFIHSMLGTQEIKNSGVARFEVPVDVASVLDGEDLVIKDGIIVGNGSYKSSATMGSVGINYQFGKKRAALASAE